MRQGLKMTKIVPAILLALALAVPANGQETCAENCGDVNHNGTTFEINDLTYLIAYLIQGGPAPFCYDEAEWDDRQLVTLNDAVQMIACLFACEFPPNCPAAGPPLVPAPDSVAYLQVRRCGLTVNPGQTSVTLPLLFNPAVRTTAVSFPLEFRVGTDIPTVSLVSWQPAAESFELGPFFSSDDRGRAHLAGLMIVSYLQPDQLMPFATLRLDFESSDMPRELSINRTTYPPVQDSQEVIIPMVVAGSLGSAVPTVPDLVVRFCTVRGDFDGDAVLNVTDLTRWINCLFGDCFFDCPEFLDIDASGTMNISDLTYLVAHLFQGGPEPPPC